MTEEIYSEVQKRLATVKLFSEAKIKIVVKPQLKQEDATHIELFNLAQYGDFSHYHIERLEFENSVSDKQFSQVRTVVAEINEMLRTGDIQNWNIFYLYKELIQKLVNDRSQGYFNYFRGQFDDWPLIPSLFRNNTKKSFIATYDRIYSDIAKEYPDVLSYVAYSKEQAEARAEQLAMLQHYGMRTSLLDITKNPFIALQFMVLGYAATDHWHVNSFDMYAIDEEKHAEENVFVAVVKNDRNKRIKAQKGAFFDYDYLNDIKETQIRLIPRLKIRVAFEIADVDNLLKAQQEEFRHLLQLLQHPDERRNSHNQSSKAGTDTLLTKQLAGNIKDIDELREKSPDLMKTRLSFLLSRDISDKLKEYFYLEKKLFPDFDKYITYLQQKNIEPREKLNR